MTRHITTLLLFCAISCFAPLTVLAVTIPTVPVGNAGNAGEVQPQGTFGAVASGYRIGTTEVSNAQYVALLNAKAASDPLALYNTSMGSGFGGITQSGSSGSFTYAVIAGRGEMPVNWVTWYDAIRYANWLHNGQGSGDTETGAYTLLGGTPTPSNGLSITRNAGATWFLTSEDEWYKAAYHKNDGVTGNYFDYPTSSDTAPTAVAPPGGSNSANYNLAAASDLSDVGAYTSSDSPYETFDQAGNLLEWNEALISGSSRGVRGGSLFDPAATNLASNRGSINPTIENSNLGFRVATIPEPSTVILAAIGLVGLAAFGWRRVKLSTLMTRTIGTLLLFCAISFFAPLTVWAVTIPTVPVGNAGNAGEVQPQGTFGAVASDYRIGTHEVTNAQYVAFLNAKAASDPLALYDTSMGSGLGGITQSGSSGSFTYAVIAGRGDMPVIFVSWYDSIRFANWLHNGQGSGDTETGAYTLLGGTPTPSNGNLITRNAGATWFLTSEDEWYKAAYHKNDGVTGNYFDYPTSSDTTPTAVGPAGGSNSANYNNAVGDFTDVGAYTGSDSPYGTFDQGGNAWEWNEALISGSFRGVRGGNFGNDSLRLLSSFRSNLFPTAGQSSVGFRVATVPEPSTVILAAIGLVGLAAFGWRRMHINKGGERS